MRHFFAVVSVLTALLLAADSALCHDNEKPRNIIILIGDGMGYNHVAAGSLYFTGELKGFAWQKFDVAVGMSTYHATCRYEPHRAWAEFDYGNYQYTDSASSATTMSTGRKTYLTALGAWGSSNYKHAMEYASENGKAIGVVTTVPLSHATPAGFIIHNQSRYNYEEIALQMLKSELDVIFGCGHPDYNGDGNPRYFDKQYHYAGGERVWNDIVAGRYGPFIESREAFQRLATGSTPKRVIGIPRVDRTLQQERTIADPYGEDIAFRDPIVQTVPTLAEMTRAALNVLDNNHNGFVVMIEEGTIDWASHDNQKDRMIEAMGSFDEAIGAVIGWVEQHSSWEETLVIVTADHETGYLTAGKGVGMDMPLKGNGIRRMPTMEFNSDEHTNHLVPFFAHGKGAEAFLKHADENDSVRGWYIDNSEMGRQLIVFLK